MIDYTPSVLIEYDPGAVVHPVRGLPPDRELAFLGTTDDDRIYLLIRPVSRSAEKTLDMHLFVGAADSLGQATDIVFTSLLGGRGFDIQFRENGRAARLYFMPPGSSQVSYDDGESHYLGILETAKEYEFIRGVRIDL
ncbi:MAG TPA: hypothetical protein VJB90_06355 [Candidatus Nanoarchaeia archaeon]|nr:hypothetical protein [Candidatus Nanoarchaeia archaeon]